MLGKTGGVFFVVVLASYAAAAVGSVALGLTGQREKGNVTGPPLSFLFLQNAGGGTFTRIAGKSNTFRLTLRGVDANAIFFTDRPARDTGLISQKALMGALFGRARSAPNAAVEVLGARKDQDVLAVKLTSPRYDARKRTLSYVVSRLNTLSSGLRHYRARADRKLAARFGSVSLFIDSGTAWGNSCTANVVNNTGSAMVWQSESQWSTDTWQAGGDPANTGIPPNGANFDAGSDSGGFARGCSFSTVWSLSDGSTISMSTTDPYTGSNSFSCVSSEPSKYQCTINGSSITDGPVLNLNWTINQV
jgi:hypothetical protein